MVQSETVEDEPLPSKILSAILPFLYGIAILFIFLLFVRAINLSRRRKRRRVTVSSRRLHEYRKRQVTQMNGNRPLIEKEKNRA